MVVADSGLSSTLVTLLHKLDKLDALSLDPGGVLPYMGYIGMCGAKGYGFSAALVINRVSILAILPSFW